VIEVACGWRGLTVWLAQGENATQAGLCWQEQRRGERIGETRRVAHARLGRENWTRGRRGRQTHRLRKTQQALLFRR
jgi:hypothetical protein